MSTLEYQSMKRTPYDPDWAVTTTGFNKEADLLYGRQELALVD
jgi:hypothetical protein